MKEYREYKIWLGLTIGLSIALAAAIAYFAFVIYTACDGFDPSETVLAGSEAESQDGGIETDENLFGDVTIIIPPEFTGGGTPETSTGGEKDDTFSNVEKLPDGSVKYTIKRSKYKGFIKELKESTAESLAGLCGDDGYQSVKNIEYNDDFSEITIDVDKENYENGYDRFVKIAAGLCCRMYQVFDVDAAQKVSIKVKDNISGDIIETAVYPEENS